MVSYLFPMGNVTYFLPSTSVNLTFSLKLSSLHISTTIFHTTSLYIEFVSYTNFVFQSHNYSLIRNANKHEVTWCISIEPNIRTCTCILMHYLRNKMAHVNWQFLKTQEKGHTCGKNWEKCKGKICWQLWTLVYIVITYLRNQIWGR